MASFDTESSAGLENATYDFVIVGGGTAGLVIANRLTENPNVRVLVLEAGTNRLTDPRINVPGLGPATFGDEDFDWNFRSSSQVCPTNYIAVNSRIFPSQALLIYIRNNSMGANYWPLKVAPWEAPPLLI
jgi:choline dehydrogenase-like flavoprotein